MAGLRERLLFDSEAGAVRDGPRRYLLMRPDVLMGLFARLDASVRTTALEAFAESAEQQGGDSLRAYFASLGGERDAFLESTAAAAADLGWGRWQFSREADALRLVVAGSPFAQGWPGAQREPVCAPIRGLLAAAATLVLGAEAKDHGPAGVRAEEWACAAAGHRRCEFVARAGVAGAPGAPT